MNLGISILKFRKVGRTSSSGTGGEPGVQRNKEDKAVQYRDHQEP
jgi:hypothetical protein